MPSCPLQRVHVLDKAVLHLAGVDDDLRVGGGDGFVDVALRAERGAGDGQRRVVLKADGVLLLILGEILAQADHLLGRHGEKHLVGGVTRRRDAVDLRGQLDFASERVGERPVSFWVAAELDALEASVRRVSSR